MTEFNERLEGEIKSHEHEMLEKIHKEKVLKRKEKIAILFEEVENEGLDCEDGNPMAIIEFVANVGVKKVLEHQKKLLEKMIADENFKSVKLHLQMELDEILECIKEL